MARRSVPLACALALAACSPPEPRRDAFTATGEIIAFSGGDGGATHACATCHGLSGEGDGRDVPRLAGLDAGYLHRQLDDYGNGRREHDAMRAVVLRLSGTDRAKVAAYYAGLPAPAMQTRPPSGLGEWLYQRGAPSRGLPACAACHGVRGEGTGIGNPPLAGQPAPFLAAQLAAWRAGRRHNDALGQMLAVSRRLTAPEIEAVALYAASLPGAAPPADREASPAARRGDPSNDASAPRRRESGSSPPAG